MNHLLFHRATEPEQEFLVRLLSGELRQGAQEGVLAEAIAKAGKLPVFYLAMRRVSRGYYRVQFVQISTGDEDLPTGALIERFAAEIEKVTRECPPDWLWNYRRWKVQRDKEGNPHVIKSGVIIRPD